MKGILERFGFVASKSKGVKNKKPWTMWGTNLIVDGKEYGYTGFDKKEMEAKVSKLKVGNIVEFETQVNGKYTNVKPETEVKVLGQGKPGANMPKSNRETVTDKDIEQMWKDSKDFVLKEVELVATNSFADVGPSINTITQAKLRLRGLR